VAAGKQAFEAAAEHAAKAQRVATDADGARIARATTVDGLTRQVEAVGAEVAGHPGADEITAALSRIDAAKTGWAEARRVEACARQAVEAATRSMKEAEANLADLRLAFDRARDAVATLAPPAPGRLDLAADWAALAGWAADTAVAQRRVEHTAAADATRLAGAAGELLTAALGAYREAGLGEPPAVAATGSGGAATEVAAGGSRRLEAMALACTKAEAEAGAQVARLREAMVEAERLGVQAADADREATVGRALARHLSAKGFERWMLAEVLDGLVAGASVLLHDLSSGAYSLATDDDGEFSVIDHRNADERRSAKTLSGGETFQASLALALALAEQLSSLAAAGAARIEATFIDEGFGSLDEDTLETVASTIEALGGDDRLVGVVTHVAALAERVPVRLEVTKGPRTATVTKVVV
jgi:exonuclease SbcC